jgi:cytochrome c1/predicted amidohydrolase
MSRDHFTSQSVESKGIWHEEDSHLAGADRPCGRRHWAFAAEEAHNAAAPTHFPINEPKEMSWSFAGPFGTYDKGQLQRGLKVYKEVCSACHSMNLVAFRTLSDLGYSDAQVKSCAADLQSTTAPTMPATCSTVPASHRTISRRRSPTRGCRCLQWWRRSARHVAARQGAWRRARLPAFVFDIFTQYAAGGPDYIHSLLTGYDQTPPAGMVIPEGTHYNPYFMSGVSLKMPKPLSDGQVTYDDGSPQTVDQYSRDVSAFLMWAAEPHMEDRKRTGFMVWPHFDWAAQEAEFRAIAVLCGDLRIFAAVGGAHRLPTGHPPHNSLYILSDSGSLLTRYDKRFLSNSELGGWYTPGTAPIIVEVDGFRLGCAICIESQFPEVFSDYERMGVDGVIFSSYGLPSYFQIALRAHAELNCLWIGAATPAQKAGKGPSGIIGPDGEWMVQCAQKPEPDLAVASLDRNDPAYDIPLQKARPWRAKARQGDIYREKLVDDPRSHNRDEY